MNDIKRDFIKELQQLKSEAGLFLRIDCTKEENKTFCQLKKDGEQLPEGVYANDLYIESNKFYRIYETGLNDSELQQFISLKQLHDIKIIKSLLIIAFILIFLVPILFNAFNR
jgi:hypothetical protein